MPKIAYTKWLEAFVAALDEAAACVADDGKISIVDGLRITAKFFRTLLS